MINYGVVFLYEGDLFVSEFTKEGDRVYLDEPAGFEDISDLFPNMNEMSMELVVIPESTDEYVDLIAIMRLQGDEEITDNLVDYLFDGGADLTELYDLCRNEYTMIGDLPSDHTIH